MSAADLPPSLGDIFTVADAAAAGVARSRLRARDLRSPHRGMRVAADHPALADPPDRDHEARRAAVAYRAVVLGTVLTPTQFLTHAAAAAAWGIPLPSRLLDPRRPLDVGVYAPLRHPRRRGVRGHQVLPGHADVVVHPESGLRVTSPVGTWAMLASELGVGDLVVAGDHLVRERMFRGDVDPLARIDDLTAVVAAGRRVGVRRLRAALPLLRTRSASPGETRCRLVLTEAGLPEPVLNHEVRDAAGRLVAVLDLAYPDRAVAVEYEGAHHLLDPGQWSRDIARYESLAGAGWTVIRVTGTQLLDSPGAVVARVRRALTAQGRSPVASGDLHRPGARQS